MDFKSKLLNDAVDQMATLPGVGKRTALRLVLHLLDQHNDDVKKFSNSFIKLKEHLNFCEDCFHITETLKCEICSNSSRNNEVICVVQDIRDLLAIESTEQFYGRYHVLGGIISPMEGIGPNDLKIKELEKRLQTKNVKELILALPATMEGDTTNFYLFRRLKDFDIKFTIISRGIGIGNQLEYIDEITLGKSLLDRTEYKSNYQ